MRGITDRRWAIAQEHEAEYQRRKAVAIRGAEVHVLAACAMRARAVRGQIESVVPLSPDTKILEVGSGPHGAGFFFDTGDITAIDPLAKLYDEAFAWAREGSRAKSVAARGEALPFDDGSFDVVISENVLDHTREPRRVLSEVRRVLRPRGVFYFAVNVHRLSGWALTSLHERLVANVRPVDMLAPHPFAFRRKDAARLLAEAGFSIVTEHEEPHVDHHHADARSRARRLARAAFDRVFPVTYWQAVAVRAR